MSTKSCTKCREIKPYSDFYKDHRNPNLLRPKCKPCHNGESAINYENNKDGWRDKFYQRKYGLTLIQYEDLLKAQNGVCAICEQVESSAKFMYLSVDHDHLTGEVRGLLCAFCNRLLGMYERNREKFDRFDTYLARGEN